MPTTQKYRILRHRDELRRIAVIVWCILIRSYFSASYKVIQSENERNDYINQVENTDRSEYYTYFSVESEKEVYSLGEPPQILSDREVLQSYPFYGTDYLHCKIGEYTTYKVISRDNRSNKIPEISDRTIRGREYNGRLPQNPIGTYIPAECYVRSKVCMSIVDGASPKCQTLVSSVFYYK